MRHEAGEGGGKGVVRDGRECERGGRLGGTDQRQLHDVGIVGLEAADVLVEGMVGWDVQEVAARALEKQSAERGREGVERSPRVVRSAA